jgi:hypothetical protein
MFHNTKDFRESAHIAEELFQNKEYELERQCMTVQSVIKKGICSMEDALSAYQVKKSDYYKYLGKAESSEIRQSIGSSIDISSTTVLVEVFLGIISETWSLPEKKAQRISKILNTVLKEEDVHVKTM